MDTPDRPPMTREEHGRLARELYAKIRPRLGPEYLDQYVAVDVETGDYEVDPDDVTAGRRLRARRPGCLPYMHRVGHRAAYSHRGASATWIG